MTGKKTTNNKESSLGLLRQRRILILISIILPLFIYGIVSIENIDMLSGINIDVEQLNIKYILAVLLVYFWIKYWQYSKVDANYIKLAQQMDKNIKYAREEFFKKIVCPNIKDCFDTEYCHITEKEDLSESKNNFFRRDKKIEICGVTYRCKNYSADPNYKVEVISKVEIEKIEKEGWQLEKNTHGGRDKPIFTKVFKYIPLKLESALFWNKLKFYYTSTYFIDYLLPYYFAAIAFSVFIADFFAFSFFIAVPFAIISVAFKNSKYYQMSINVLKK